MGFQVSPGVRVSEIDLTTTVGKGLSTSIGAFAGNFKWGPVEERVLISTEVELVNTFRKPDADTFKNFFTVANFLTYTNACYVVRTGDANTSSTLKNAGATSAVLVKNDTTYADTTLTGTGEFIARYPGALGNSIIVAAFDASTSANTIFTSNILTANTAMGVGTTVIDKVGTWKDNFGYAPNTSDYAANAGGAHDEINIIVIDRDGKFTGTPGTILEKFAGVSKIKGSKTDDGTFNYYADVINNTSSYIRVGGSLLLGADPTKSATYSWPQTNTTEKVFYLQNGVDAATPDLSTGYELFRNSDEVDVSFLIAGDLNGEANASEAKKLVGIAEYRKDAIAFISAPLSKVQFGISSSTIANNLVEYKNITLNSSSSYYVMDSAWKYQYDKYNDTYRWIPLNGDIAGLCARTDLNRDPWWSPAGFNRGSINNVIKLSWNPNQAQRDQIYVAGINPVVSFPGEGTILYGDKTGLSKPSAFDRINVRRLFITLEKSIAAAAKYSLFEFNDEFTRAQFVSMVEPFLREVKSRRGIYDFKVVCDESNNTPQVIDNNEFVGDIYVKPAKSINYIQLNFVAVRTGVDFNEIVGQF